MSETITDRLTPNMPPISLNEVSRALSLMNQRVENMEDKQDGKWDDLTIRDDRIDAHLRATDARVDELRMFMVQVKTIGIIVGIVWPLIVKYVLPK